MSPTGDLLECRYPVSKMFESDSRLQCGETKVDLAGTDGTDRPFDVVIPELLVTGDKYLFTDQVNVD